MVDTLKNIKINVGYDEIKDSRPVLNLHNYDISLNDKLTIDKLFDNTYGNFITNTTSHYHEKKSKFIYPIIIFNDNLFFNYETVELSEQVIESTRNGFCKIVFVFVTEGFFGVDIKHFNWINSLVTRYGFSKDNVIVLTANLIANKLYSHNNFTIYTYSFFDSHISFIRHKDKLRPNIQFDLKNKYLDFLEQNKKIKDHHFLCFNGVPRVHRLLLFATLMTNDNLKNKTISSLGTEQKGSPDCDNMGEDYFFKQVENFFKNKSLKNKNDILDFYKNYNSTINHFYDIPGPPKNKAHIFNEEAHKNSFINIVTETLFDIDETIFFSEKVFKPIYACQPFILVGCHKSLDMLKRMGYLTFGEWWDESYDDEFYPDKRVDKIIKLIDDVATWHPVKCNRVLIEMSDVLEHNYKKLIDYQEIIKLYEFLCTHKESKSNTLL